MSKEMKIALIAALIGAIATLIAALITIVAPVFLSHTTSTSSSSPSTPVSRATQANAQTTVVKPSPTPIVTPTASATDWGVLDGDAITVKKMLTCGSGCPDPLHVEVQTIQIDKGNNTATFTVHYSASVPNIAAGTVYFSDFSLQSDVTSPTEASQTPINSTQTIIAKFPLYVCTFWKGGSGKGHHVVSNR